jgi:hypothetical protein
VPLPTPTTYFGTACNYDTTTTDRTHPRAACAGPIHAPAFSVPASPGTLAAQAVGSVPLRVGPQCAHGRTLGPMSAFLPWGLFGGPPRLPEKVARTAGQQAPAPELAEQQRSWLVASPNHRRWQRHRRITKIVNLVPAAATATCHAQRARRARWCIEWPQRC